MVKRQEYTIDESENNRLIIFGDSFAETSKRWDFFSSERLQKVPGHIRNLKPWSTILANKLKCSKLVNYGRGGSSLFYSMQCINQYIETDYNPNDYIIFITTSPHRLPIIWDVEKYKDIEPGWQAVLMSFMTGKMKDDWPQSKFYNDNKQVCEWVFNHLSTDKNHAMMIRFSTSYITNLPNKSICIPAFDTEGSDFVIGDIDSLFKISHDEFIMPKNNNTVLDVFSGDWRLNHLSQYNNNVLATQINNYFITNDKSVFKKDEYEKFMTDVDEFNHMKDIIRNI